MSYGQGFSSAAQYTVHHDGVQFSSVKVSSFFGVLHSSRDTASGAAFDPAFCRPVLCNRPRSDRAAPFTAHHSRPSSPDCDSYHVVVAI